MALKEHDEEVCNIHMEVFFFMYPQVKCPWLGGWSTRLVCEGPPVPHMFFVAHRP